MQRKRHINFKDKELNSSSSGYKNNKLHSIPILSSSVDSKNTRNYNNLMKNNLKSNALYSIPCVKSCACTFCRVVNTLRSNSSNSNNNVYKDLLANTSYLGARSRRLPLQGRAATSRPSLRIPCGKSVSQAESAIPSSQVVMTPLSRILNWKKTAAFTILLLSISFLSSIMLNNGSCSAVTSASLELSTNKLSGSTVENGTAIASTNVKVVVSDALDYSLILKVDNTGLTNGSTTINAGNVVDDNTWGYKWDTETSYTAPSTSGKNLTVPALANNSVNFTKTLTFGAKFGSDATAGTYSASGTLSLVATPATTYTITYNANGGTGAPSSTTCTAQGASGTNCTTTLSSTKPTRTNYTFLGWSTSSTATTASYSAGGTISISSNTTLYAVWKATDPWANITTMQQMTTSACSAASVGKSKTLTDSRDSSTYTVRKMEDGKCWMTSNLKIINKTITSADSDVSSSFTIPASNIANFNTSTSVGAFLPAASDVSDGSDINNITNTGYYTWCAATAGTCSNATSGGMNASSSICPKGWKLPTGMVTGTNATNDFYNLFKNMGLSISGSLSTTGATSWGTGDLAIAQGAPYNLTNTGCIFNGSFVGTSSYGRWWSRTPNESAVYYLNMQNTTVQPGTTYITSRDGLAVRCVAQ